MKGNTDSRLDWLDYLKAWGMCLVVYGHSGAINASVDTWIYAFHMPLFFLASGYLFKESSLEDKTLLFFKRQFLGILPAYLTFAAIGFVMWLVVARYFGGADQDIPVAYPVFAFLYGTGTPEIFRVVPVVLWYFPCLLCSQILAYLILKHGGKGRLVFSACVGGVGVLLPHTVVLPFELETALMGQFFILLGFQARRLSLVSVVGGRYWYLSVPGLLGLGTIAALMNTRVDMRSDEYGNVALFLVGSLSLCLGFTGIFYRLKHHRLAELISKNSIIIFPLHTIAFSALKAFCLIVVGIEVASIDGPWLNGFEALAITLGLAMLGGLFKFFLPWVYGVRVKV